MKEEEHEGNPTLDDAPVAEPVAGAAECASDEAVLDDLSAQLEALAIERDKLAAEVDDLRDHLLRRQAEFENFRRRMENEKADFARYAGMESVRELLPVLDDLERAMQAAPSLDGPDGEFVKGVEIIYQRFLDALKRVGLEPIESVGKPFDPHVHHAVETVPTEEIEHHTVLEEWQRGYNFKGRLLREAMVRVAVRPAEPSGATDSQ